MRRPLLSYGLAALAALALTAALGAAGAPQAVSTARAAAGPPATPCAGAWQRKADYPFPVLAPAAVAQNGFIYSFAGYGVAASAVKYDPAANQWSALTAPPVGHDFSSALSDGTSVYLLNGRTSTAPDAALTRYDPGTDSYTALAPPPLATVEQAAVYLDGKIYRIAGFDGVTGTTTVDVYTVATDAWADAGTIAPYPLPVAGLNAVAWGGYIYAGGGVIGQMVSTKTYRYDPLTNEWDDAAVPDLAVGRYLAASGILNGRWIISGGFAWDYQLRQDTVALDLGDPAAGWTALPWAPTWRWYSAGAVAGDAFYTIGSLDPGGQAQPDVYAYTDSPCGSPTPSPTPTAAPTPPACGVALWQAPPPYPIPVAVPGVVALGGALYSFGGFTNNVAVADSFRYDPQTNVWAPIAPLPEARFAAVVSDGRYLYILNGGDMTDHYRNTLYRYDPQTNTYATLAPAPLATGLHAAAYLNGKIYRIAGDTNSWVHTTAVDRYDIATNTWAPAGTVAAYPISTRELTAVSYGGFLYGLAGMDSGGKTYRYDPAANSWDDAAVTDLPNAPIGPVAAALNGRLVVAGGIVNPSGGSPARALDFADTTGPWAPLPDMPVGRFDAGGAAFNGSVYSIGGFGGQYWTASDVQQYTEGVCATPTATATPTSPPATATRTAAPDPTTTAPATATRLPATATAPAPTRTASPSATVPAPTLTPAPNSPTPAATAAPPSPSATPCALGFSDVRPSDYFYAPAQYLACRGVISGYADGTFRPYAGTTRAQVVKIVTLAFSVPPAPAPPGGTFADVPPSHPFFAAVETAAARALVSGYACGGPAEPCDAGNRPYFRPYAPVTRGQLAKIVVAAAGWAPREPAAATFLDVAPGSAFYGFVETAVCRGVLSGYACGAAGEPCDAGNRPYFRPGAGATRGQIAKIVYNAVAAPAPCAP